MAKCPYCKDGKIVGKIADSGGRGTHNIEQGCHKCGGEGQGETLKPGAGQIDCFDSNHSDITVGDVVMLKFHVANIHPRPDGGYNIELGIIDKQGNKTHFHHSIVPSDDVYKCEFSSDDSKAAMSKKK